jgi:hypothetical protein
MAAAAPSMVLDSLRLSSQVKFLSGNSTTAADPEVGAAAATDWLLCFRLKESSSD